MEASLKRQRLQTSEFEETKSFLLSLNTDCILKIFEWLELDELCVMSETCKKLKNLAGDYFRIKYRNKILSELRVEVTLDGKIRLSPLQDYTTYFTKYLQNVTIGGGYQLRPLDIGNFIRHNCNRYVREIAFEHLKLNRLHGSLIIDWLKEVERVTFYSCENVHHILRYCEKIKYLKVDKYSKDVSNRWMIEKYPTLEYVQYDMALPSKDLFTFLRINPNVKGLLWEFDRFNKRVTQTIIHKLSFINLEQLLLTLDDFEDLELITNELIKICEGDRFKRLELCFNDFKRSDHNFVKLKSLKCLEGLHFLRMEKYAIPQNVLLEHLKVLHCSYILMHNTTTLDKLSKNLPNLEELYLMELALDFKTFVTPFIRNSVKLNKIVARDFKRPNRNEVTNFHLTNYFHNEREKLPNACKLIVFIGKDEYDVSFDSTSSKCPLVQIRKVEFQSKRVDHVKPYLRNFAF